MRQAAADCILPARAMLGESPLWSADEQRLYWVDTLAPALHRFDPTTGIDETWPLPSDAGCIALDQSGAVIAALRSGLWRLDLAGGVHQRLCPAPFAPEQTRFNDGRCDPAGRFWAGSLYEPREPPLAALYRYDPSSGFSAMVREVAVSNGLAWSPDGRVMYHADTPSHIVWAYSFDAGSGSLGGRRIYLDFRSSQQRPDGACVDAAGNYWVALYGAGLVAQFSPAGQPLAEIRLPVKAPTMPALGGPDLKTLYITTARQKHSEAELAAMPLAGGLFSCAVDIPGLPEPRCRL